MRGTKDLAGSRDNRKPNPRTETPELGRTHLSEEARVQKAETKRLKKRRAKDRNGMRWLFDERETIVTQVNKEKQQS